MEKEIWKDVVGYEGMYQVSNLGRVKSLDRYVNHLSGGKSRIKGITLKNCINKLGYPVVYLSRNDSKKTCTVHRLVAIAFIPPVKNKNDVNHIDGVKTNNDVSNLEWCNHKENVRHAYKLGLNKGKKGEEHPRSKLSDQDIAKIKKDLKYNNRHWKEIAKEYGIGKTWIYMLKRGDAWSHIEV